jgi:hypothetical protein
MVCSKPEAMALLAWAAALHPINVQSFLEQFLPTLFSKETFCPPTPDGKSATEFVASPPRRRSRTPSKQVQQVRYVYLPVARKSGKKKHKSKVRYPHAKISICNMGRQHVEIILYNAFGYPMGGTCVLCMTP